MQQNITLMLRFCASVLDLSCHLTGDLADGPSEPVGPSFFIPLSDAIHSVEKGTFP